MEDKIRIIIADDNKGICDLLKNYLKQYEEIEIVGIAYTDEEELMLIKKEKPDIIITDLVRNRKYTGLDIIKDFNKKKEGYKFLVISADDKEQVIDESIEIGGYIKKPFADYSIIIEEIKKIREKELIKKNEIITEKQKDIIKYNFMERISNLFKVGK